MLILYFLSNIYVIYPVFLLKYSEINERLARFQRKSGIIVFCSAEELFVRSWEIPEGNRKVLKILSGATGGEIRMYRKIRDSLELIEHAHIATALSEFGQPETSEQ